jgi:branched-chain amino acid transport system ATP-binding protein
VRVVADLPLVEARDLHSYYGASHVLHGIDFLIRPGETIGLMGRNGMGKTTLIRTLAGHIRPRRGSIRIDGQEVTGSPPHSIAKQGIAYVPEDRGIFPNLTVRENLLMAARRGLDRAPGWTLDRVLTTFPRLAERLSLGGQQLSGGEQQMLTVARALMTNPRLLILDEATEGLAPLVAEEIWKILRELRASGMSSIVVDKNFAAVTAMSDRNMILVKGRVAFEGTSHDFRLNPDPLHRFLGI